MLPYLGLAWLTGTFFGSLLPQVGFFVWLGAVGLGLSAVVAWRRPGLGRAALVGAILLSGLLRYQMHVAAETTDSLGSFNNSGPRRVRGVVGDEPQPRGATQSLRLQVEEVETAAGWQRATGGILVTTAPYPHYSVGDRLLLSGPLEDPRPIGDFDYPAYLARQGVRTVIQRPQIVREASGEAGVPWQWLYRLRARLAQSLGKALPEPQAALAQGILLGERGGLPPDLVTAFQRTGATHIIAISGQNVVLIGGYLLALGRLLLGRQRAAYFAVVCLALYTVLAGGAPSVVRASIMAALTLLAAQWGRQPNALNFLLLSAAALTAHWPPVLWDLGFQLSFLATAALVLLLPATQAAVLAAGGWAAAAGRPPAGIGGWALENLLVTAVATAATAPLLALAFHTVSPLAPLATLLASPALAPIILTSGLTALAGLLQADLAALVGWLAWICLTYLIGIVENLSAQPLAAVSLALPPSAVLLWYGSLAAVALAADRRGQLGALSLAASRLGAAVLALPLRWTAGALAVAVLLVWSAVLVLPDDYSRVTFLDVGQGDATLVRSHGRKVLIDGGGDPRVLASQLGRKLPFWDRHLDLIVLSHPHEDHLAGLLAVVERYHVGQVLESDQAEPTATYARWRELVAAQRLPRTLARAGQQIRLAPDVTISVLASGEAATPPGGASASALNESSLVLQLVVGEVTVLLPGDLEGGGQQRLLANGLPLASTVLKVPHHGAAAALDSAFLSAVAPSLAVISVGQSNRFGHPAASTLAQLETTAVYRTDRQGNVELVTDGRRYWMEVSR